MTNEGKRAKRWTPDGIADALVPGAGDGMCLAEVAACLVRAGAEPFRAGVATKIYADYFLETAKGAPAERRTALLAMCAALNGEALPPEGNERVWTRGDMVKAYEAMMSQKEPITMRGGLLAIGVPEAAAFKARQAYLDASGKGAELRLGFYADEADAMLDAIERAGGKVSKGTANAPPAFGPPGTCTVCFGLKACVRPEGHIGPHVSRSLTQTDMGKAPPPGACGLCNGDGIGQDARGVPESPYRPCDGCAGFGRRREPWTGLEVGAIVVGWMTDRAPCPGLGGRFEAKGAPHDRTQKALTAYTCALEALAPRDRELIGASVDAFAAVMAPTFEAMARDLNGPTGPSPAERCTGRNMRGNVEHRCKFDAGHRGMCESFGVTFDPDAPSEAKVLRVKNATVTTGDGTTYPLPIFRMPTQTIIADEPERSGPAEPAEYTGDFSEFRERAPADPAPCHGKRVLAGKVFRCGLKAGHEMACVWSQEERASAESPARAVMPDPRVSVGLPVVGPGAPFEAPPLPGGRVYAHPGTGDTYGSVSWAAWSAWAASPSMRADPNLAMRIARLCGAFHMAPTTDFDKAATTAAADLAADETRMASAEAYVAKMRADNAAKWAAFADVTKNFTLNVGPVDPKESE